MFRVPGGFWDRNKEEGSRVILATLAGSCLTNPPPHPTPATQYTRTGLSANWSWESPGCPSTNTLKGSFL